MPARSKTGVKKEKQADNPVKASAATKAKDAAKKATKKASKRPNKENDKSSAATAQQSAKQSQQKNQKTSVAGRTARVSPGLDYIPPIFFTMPVSSASTLLRFYLHEANFLVPKICTCRK